MFCCHWTVGKQLEKKTYTFFSSGTKKGALKIIPLSPFKTHLFVKELNSLLKLNLFFDMCAAVFHVFIELWSVQLGCSFLWTWFSVCSGVGGRSRPEGKFLWWQCLLFLFCLVLLNSFVCWISDAFIILTFCAWSYKIVFSEFLSSV